MQPPWWLSSSEKEHPCGTDTPHPQRHDKGQRSNQRNGTLSGGPWAKDRRPSQTLLPWAVKEGKYVHTWNCQTNTHECIASLFVRCLGSKQAVSMILICVAVYLSIVVCVVLLDKKVSQTCNFCYICGWSPVGLILWKYYLQNNHCYTVRVCVCTSQVAIILLIHCVLMRSWGNTLQWYIYKYFESENYLFYVVTVHV